MDFVLPAAIAALILAAALLGLRGMGSVTKKRESEKKGGRENKAGGGGMGACPLCGSALGPGERVKSDILPGKSDRMMRIYGCPHCWPSVEGKSRNCPVCGEALDPGSWAVARYFEKPGRRHVHVLGCERCRSPRKDG